MTKHKTLSVVWFLLGFGIFMFSRASKVIPFMIPGGLAMLIAPIFILGFIRSHTTKRGILFTLLGFLVSLNIALWGLFGAGDGFSMMFFDLVRSSVLAILFSLPYILDRVIYPTFKEKGLLSTFTFPIITTATFFLTSLEGPFDGDAIFAVFGYGHLYFQQIASIAGLWGFVFMFSWCAAVINYGWEQKWKWGKIKNATVIFASVLLIILVFGAIKTSSLIRSESDTVKIASIILLPEEGKAVDPQGLYKKESSPFEETLSRIETLTEKAASQHVNVVTFQETVIKIPEDDETRLMNRLQEMAKEHAVYVSVSYGVYPGEGKGWNKHVLINNQGDMDIEYRKRYLLGLGDLFGETLLYKKGPEIIQTTETPYGRIGVSICRDLSFPPYARQAGQKHVDIMLNPSYDVPKSTGPLYSLRAIENGFSLVRPVYNGFSYAIDYHGKILAHMDSDHTEDGIMYADVPTKGVKTLYSIIGDLLGWLCVLGLGACVVMSIKDRVHKKHN